MSLTQDTIYRVPKRMQVAEEQQEEIAPQILEHLVMHHKEHLQAGDSEILNL